MPEEPATGRNSKDRRLDDRSLEDGRCQRRDRHTSEEITARNVRDI
jgi:hypothetical protein